MEILWTVKHGTEKGRGHCRPWVIRLGECGQAGPHRVAEQERRRRLARTGQGLTGWYRRIDERQSGARPQRHAQDMFWRHAEASAKAIAQIPAGREGARS